MGKPYADATARSYQELKPSCARPCSTRSTTCARASTSWCARARAAPPRSTCAPRRPREHGPRARREPAGRARVGDIDRGGVFPALYGTLALLEPEDQALIAGFLINKFRGDPSILEPGPGHAAQTSPADPRSASCRGSTGRSSTPRTRSRCAATTRPRGTLDVVVIRLRWMSNFTDVDALAAEPGVSVRYTRSPADIERADLVVLPGTKATVEDLKRLRDDGLDHALQDRTGPILGICGGYQMLGHRIEDGIEIRRQRRRPRPAADSTPRFAPEKLLRQVHGTVWGVDAPATRSATAASTATSR